MIIKISFSQTIGQEILNYNNGCGNPTTDSGGVVIRTKYPFIATGYMPTMIIEGYNYGLNQSVGLIINWYVYNNGSIPYFYHKSISSYGAYAPEAYIYNDAGFVSIFLKRGVSQYCLSFKVRSWLRDINESSSNNSWYLGWTANTINTPPTGVNNYQNLRYENTIGDATVLGSRPIRLNSGAGSIKIKGDTGGWAMDHGFLGSGGADLGGFWGYGAANAIDQWSIGKAYTDNFFVVKSSGNVGIGTNTPSAKLEVVGNANISGIFKTANIEVGNLSGDNNIQIGSGGGTIGNRWAYLDLVGDDKYNDYGLRLIRQNTGENAASQIIHRGTGDLQIYTNDFAPISFITGATEKMRVAANGNVGIGTIAPSEKFTVYGVNNSAPAILSLESSREDIANADVAMIKFKNSGNEIARIGTIRPAGSYTGLINFWVKKTNETPLFEAMRISESGNVGIGTANPLSPLHIFGGSTMTHGWNKTLTLQASYPTIIFNSNAQKWGGIGYDFSSNMNFWVGGSSDDLTSTATAAMSIAQNGNVGIGVTPTLTSAKLEVAGTTVTTSLKLSGLTGGTIRPLAVNALGEVITGDAVVANPSANAWTLTGNNISNSALTGNVGIGTATPSNSLSVVKNHSGPTSISVSNLGTPGSNTIMQFLLSEDGISTQGYLRRYRDGSGLTEVGYTDALAFSGGVSSTKSEKMRISTEGNVGIGTTNPTQKLEVNSGSIDTGTLGQITTSAVSGLKGISGINFKIDVTNLWQMHTDNTAGNGFFLQYNENKAKRYFAVNTNGNVGIGTITPEEKLSVLHEGGTTPIKAFGIDVTSFSTTPNALNSYFFRVRDIGASSTPFIINGVGQVGIGVTTMPSGYKLAVAGDIIAERVVVKLTGTWPDYVFKKNYDLRPLEQVEQYINQNSHLPEVPSAQEVINKGIDVGAMNAKLLQKVEELTLYLIEQNKENKMQNNEITILKQQLESIKIRNDKCPN